MASPLLSGLIPVQVATYLDFIESIQEQPAMPLDVLTM